MHVIPRGKDGAEEEVACWFQSPAVSAAIARLHDYSKARWAIRSGVLSSGNIKVDPKPS